MGRKRRASAAPSRIESVSSERREKLDKSNRVNKLAHERRCTVYLRRKKSEQAARYFANGTSLSPSPSLFLISRCIACMILRHNQVFYLSTSPISSSLSRSLYVEMAKRTLAAK